LLDVLKDQEAKFNRIVRHRARLEIARPCPPG
jgi:hypothetical protein